MYTYRIQDLRGNFIKAVRAKDVFAAAEQVATLWPCRIHGGPLKSPVIVEPDGTLDFSGGRIHVNQADFMEFYST